LIPLTVPEVRRLLRLVSEAEEQRLQRLHWSRWRRRHQAVAQRSHIARRARQRPARAERPPVVGAVPGTAALTDAHWAQLAPLLPPQKPRTGRPALDHRRVLEGMLWVMRTGAPWRELPARYGSWQTIYSRHQRWGTAGIWDRILAVLHQTDGTLPQAA
jgi:transposase